MTIPLQEISDTVISQSGVNLLVLRLDLAHPVIKGNKWFKLKYNLEEAKKQNKKALLTFGGAFSNHITATAAAGTEFDFKTIGIIRGEELTENSNAVLKNARENGMHLHFVSREHYRKRFRKDFLNELSEKFNHPYIIPEGGSNDLAVKGCSEILEHLKTDFDYVVCPVGTGATLAGLSVSLSEKQQAIGFSVLANANFLDDNLNLFIKNYSGKENVNAKIIHEYHFGGHAQSTKQLFDFMKFFEEENKIPLEHVYTGKMMFGTYDLIRKGFFVSDETIVAVHTGGL